MRVTTAGQTHAIITRLQNAQEQLAAAQRTAVTGLKLEKLSDDPTSGAALMQVGAGVRGGTQYARNVDRMKASLDAEDGVLQQLGDLTLRARELGVGANSASSSPTARAASANELRQLLGQAVNLGNTKIGETYLFGGLTNDGRPPFDENAASWVVTDAPAAGSPAGTPSTPRFPEGEIAVEAGAGGQRLAGPHDGTTVFLGRAADGTPDATKGVIPALKQMLDALESGDQSAVASALTTLDSADLGLQATVGNLGARQNHADTLSAGLASLQDTLTQHKSDLGEVDAEQAITEMLSRQTAYQAAMLASSKVMGMSLADYLR